MSVPGDAVTLSNHPCPHTQGFGKAEEEDAGIQCGWKRLGGASEVRAQCEAAGGGREEQKGRKDGAVVKGDQELLCCTSRLGTSGKSWI